MLQNAMLNELELSVNVTDSKNIDVKFTLQDMRFVFSVPTA